MTANVPEEAKKELEEILTEEIRLIIPILDSLENINERYDKWKELWGKGTYELVMGTLQRVIMRETPVRHRDKVEGMIAGAFAGAAVEHERSHMT